MSRIETVRNLQQDPRCLMRRGGWNCSSSIDNGRYRYEANSGATGASVSAWHPLSNQYMAGKVLYARITAGQAVLDLLDVEKATTIARHDNWIAARVADSTVGNHSIWLMRGPVTLEEVGCYSPEDWERLYALYQKGEIQYPWCAGPRDATMAGEKGPWEL
ncbi:hypothetical protein [Bifidobacterium criceti]|uniref:Uncharacterized protein n=1 Tax=Bifidobacterium criceti TaxID=1960969 RepID=A0A2A2EDY6_9BIFI|nr:hypothetical protein [Bifidobacterium criceti]PAU67231.1 hypothetical protein B1526_1315 [Bifidobacterium criceti]